VLGIRNERLAGMAAMLIGTASFAFMDAGLKLLTAHYPASQVAALRGLTALPVVFLWAAFAGGLAQLARVRWPLHMVRGVLSVFMMISYTFALKELSLANAYALFFVAPLIIAVLSIFMLGDRVTTPQWFAIVLGFGGVLIVARPGTQGFGSLGTLAILGTAFAYALSSILVKIIGRTDSTQSMIFWMTCMLAIGATLLALPEWRPVQRAHYPIMLGIALTGAVGQWGITVAFKHAAPASVAPLEYSAIAWVIALDFLLWSALPGWNTLIGAAVIIASGLFVLRYEARRAIAATAARDPAA
jgi:drug/metabolite transporter (DMT)-like permease